MGIHRGPCILGMIGEAERIQGKNTVHFSPHLLAHCTHIHIFSLLSLSGTVISDAVNLAARLESLTKTFATAILISSDVYNSLPDPNAFDHRYVNFVQRNFTEILS